MLRLVQSSATLSVLTFYWWEQYCFPDLEAWHEFKTLRLRAFNEAMEAIHFNTPIPASYHGLATLSVDNNNVTLWWDCHVDKLWFPNLRVFHLRTAASTLSPHTLIMLREDMDNWDPNTRTIRRDRDFDMEVTDSTDTSHYDAPLSVPRVLLNSFITFDAFGFTRDPLPSTGHTRSPGISQYKATALAFKAWNQREWVEAGFKVPDFPRFFAVAKLTNNKEAFITQKHPLADKLAPSLEVLHIISDTVHWKGDFTGFMIEFTCFEGKRYGSEVPITLGDLHEFYETAMAERIEHTVRGMVDCTDLDCEDPQLVMRIWQSHYSPLMPRMMRHLAVSCPMLEEVEWISYGKVASVP
ncbi:hypothetical protein BKA93DRAFT_745895 [Sparassis latifolia]